VQQAEKVVKSGFGEVGDKVKNEEAANGAFQGDLGSGTKRFLPLKEVTQQRGIFGILLQKVGACTF